jgi:hypothetical protein
VQKLKQFISEDAVIAPNENMPIVFMPMDALVKLERRTTDSYEARLDERLLSL